MEYNKWPQEIINQSKVYRTHHIDIAVDINKFMGQYDIKPQLYNKILITSVNPIVRYYINVLGRLKRMSNISSYYEINPNKPSSNLSEQKRPDKFQHFHPASRDTFMLDSTTSIIARHNIDFFNEYPSILPTNKCVWFDYFTLNKIKCSEDILREYINDEYDNVGWFQQNKWVDFDRSHSKINQVLLYEDIFITPNLEGTSFEGMEDIFKQYHKNNIKLFQDIDKTFGTHLQDYIP